MLRELSQWGIRYFRSLEEGDKLPKEFVQLGKDWIGDVTHHWAHLGGVIDPGCIKVSPRKRKIFEKALVVASELSARMGASLLFHSSNVRQTASILTLQVWLHGLQKGLSESEMLSAWNFVLYNPPQFHDMNGVDRRQVWTTLDQWVQTCISNPKHVPKWDPSNLLSTVRFGLSSVWYLTTIRRINSKGAFEWLTAVQSVEEILNRHVKAASKRLRYQQIDKLEITVPHIFEGTDGSFKEWVAKFILTHEWSEMHDDQSWCAENFVATQDVASKISVKYAPALTESMLAQWLIELPDIFVGTSTAQIETITGLSMHWTAVRSHRTLKNAIKECAYASGIPTQNQLDAFIPQVPVEVRLMTTRGGTWPERRQQIVFASN